MPSTAANECSDPVKSLNYSLCTSNDSLAALEQGWRQSGLVALDTEFIRTDTFYPIPALYQVTHRNEAVLLDVLAIENWQPFCNMLTDPDIVKVMHGCGEDMEVLEVHLAVNPVNLFDSQLAHAFVSDRFSISYAALVEEIAAVELPKHSTRSNWLKRPLTLEQMQYAAEDVEYLLPVYESLTERLRQMGRLQWFAEETAARPLFRYGIPAEYYRGLRQARRMDARQLCLLQALTRWREDEAMLKNVPRGRVVRDEHLLRLAEKRLLKVDDIFDELPHRVACRYQEAMLRVAAEANTRKEDDLPELLEAPLTQSQGELVKKLRMIARKKAAQLGIAQELLARKRDLEACLQHFFKHGELPQMYRGWRADVLAREFCEVLQRYAIRH